MSLFSGETPALGTNATINGSKIVATRLVSFPIFAGTVNQPIYIAPAVAGEGWQLVSASVVFGTASTSGTLGIEYLTGTQAPGAGTALLTAPVSLSGAANTSINAVPKVAKVLHSGDRLGIVLAGTLTNLAGGLVQLALKKV